MNKVEVKKCMHLLEDATRLVSAIGLFSDNESIDEVATNNLKYMLLPYFLGQLSQKLCKDDRQEIVQVAEVYFKWVPLFNHLYIDHNRVLKTEIF